MSTGTLVAGPLPKIGRKELEQIPVPEATLTLGSCSAAALAASSRQFFSCILPSLARCGFGTLSFQQSSDFV